jgi:hypothetical protein
MSATFPLVFFLQLRGLATALSRKVLHDLTAAQHFKGFFVIRKIRIFRTKTEKFQLRSNNSVCPEAFQLLCSSAPAQLKGNIACRITKTEIQTYRRNMLYIKLFQCKDF